MSAAECIDLIGIRYVSFCTLFFGSDLLLSGPDTVSIGNSIITCRRMFVAGKSVSTAEFRRDKIAYHVSSIRGAVWIGLGRRVAGILRGHQAACRGQLERVTGGALLPA